MNPSANLENNQTLALLESLALISTAFWGPTPDACLAMLEANYTEPLERLQNLCELDLVKAVNQITLFLNQHETAPVLQDSLDSIYIRLFITDREGIATPIFHSCYGLEGTKQGGALMGEPAMKMQGYLRETGMALDESIGEPPDHLAIELEYLYFLLEKWYSSRQTEYLHKARRLARTFMLPWVTELGRRLALEKDTHFYPPLISILVAILRVIGNIDKQLSDV